MGRVIPVSLAALVLSSVQLSGAEVDVRLRTDGATVAVRYDFVAPPGDLVLRAIDLPAHSLMIVESSAVLQSDAEDDGLEWRVSLDSDSLFIRYEVTGAVDRLPLLLPNIATVPGASSVHVRVSGYTTGVSLVDAFPRMSVTDEGILEASPTNLPSVILLPRDRRVSFARAADGVTLALLVLASLYWFRRRRVGH